MDAGIKSAMNTTSPRRTRLRWEAHLSNLKLHESLHTLQSSQIVALTEALYVDVIAEVSVFFPAFEPYLVPRELPATDSATNIGIYGTRGGSAAQAAKHTSSSSPCMAALRLWSSRWRAVSYTSLEPLSEGSLPAAEKMEALGDWAPLWPPLESLNRLLSAHGEPILLDVHAIVEPLMHEYIANLTTRFDVELEAAWSREQWAPQAISEGQRHATVVWDMFSLFSSSLEVFFEQARSGGPMRAQWVETVAERCFFILNKFLNRMRQDLGSDAALLPPKPAYPELQDLGGLTKGLATGLKALLRRGSVRDAQATVSAICVRIHSLSFCLEQLRHLSASIDASWKALLKRRAADGDTVAAAELPPRTIFHEGAPEAVAACCEEVCWFLGAKVVYDDLREAIFESLYCRERDVSGKADPKIPLRPTLSSMSSPAITSVADSVGDASAAMPVTTAERLPLLVDLLEPVLVALNDDLLPSSSPLPSAPNTKASAYTKATAECPSSSAPPADSPCDVAIEDVERAPNYANTLRDAAVRGVMVALVQALEQVLLDGGPRRVFCSADGPLLMEDVKLVREFFIARDEAGVPHGLDESEVLRTTKRLEHLVMLMHLPTGDLISRFLNPPDHLPDHHSSEALTRANLARVLLHRAAADPHAKNFVYTHRAWLGRVLSRVDTRSESVRERCFGVASRHPLASPLPSPVIEPVPQLAAHSASPNASCVHATIFSASPVARIVDAGAKDVDDHTDCVYLHSPSNQRQIRDSSPSSVARSLVEDSDDPFDTPYAAVLTHPPALQEEWEVVDDHEPRPALSSDVITQSF